MVLDKHLWMEEWKERGREGRRAGEREEGTPLARMIIEGSLEELTHT